MTRPFLYIITFAFVSCNYGKLNDKDLSMSNISYIELTFPKSTSGEYPIRLDTTQLISFTRIINKRKLEYAEPANCYDLFIKLKEGGSVNYRTDGIRFQGYDDTSDLPFSFSLEENILTEVFKLKNIEHCKSGTGR
jgi:hypothetical protein